MCYEILPPRQQCSSHQRRVRSRTTEPRLKGCFERSNHVHCSDERKTDHYPSKECDIARIRSHFDGPFVEHKELDLWDFALRDPLPLNPILHLLHRCQSPRRSDGSVECAQHGRDVGRACAQSREVRKDNRRVARSEHARPIRCAESIPKIEQTPHGRVSHAAHQLLRSDTSAGMTVDDQCLLSRGRFFGERCIDAKFI